MKKLGRRKQLKITPIDREAEETLIKEAQEALNQEVIARQQKIEKKNKHNLLPFEVEDLKTLTPKEKKAYIKELYSYL